MQRLLLLPKLADWYLKSYHSKFFKVVGYIIASPFALAFDIVLCVLLILLIIGTFGLIKYLFF